MKLSRYVWLFWLGNCVLLTGVGAFLWSANSDARTQRNARTASVAAMNSTETRVAWKESETAKSLDVQDMLLSPTERPKPAAPVVMRDPSPPPAAKTDEQLKSELTAELNRKFKLLRLALSSSDKYPSIATLVADNVRLQWFEGMDLADEYGRASSAELNRLAYDLQVLSIDENGVLVNAASLEKPAKRFDVRISVFDGESTTSMMSADYVRDTSVLKLGEHGKDKNDTLDRGFQPRNEPAPPGPQSEVKPEDFDEHAVDELSKWIKPTEHGLQVSPELPEDSPARKYGARGGEIIKTINGKPVRSMSDVRREVRTQYDAGTREFKVGFERDGIPGERTITAPQK